MQMLPPHLVAPPVAHPCKQAKVWRATARPPLDSRRQLSRQAPSEVVRESLRLLRREDEIQKLQLEELRREIKTSIKQLDDGQGVSLEDVRVRIQKRRARNR